MLKVLLTFCSLGFSLAAGDRRFDEYLFFFAELCYLPSLFYIGVTSVVELDAYFYVASKFRASFLSGE